MSYEKHPSTVVGTTVAAATTVDVASAVAVAHPVAVAADTPLSILGSKLHTWYRSDVATVTGAGVSSWTDQSGNANHAVQGTDANRPPLTAGLLNGKAGLVFTAASSQYLRTAAYHAALTQPCETVIIADFLTNFATIRTLVSGLTNGNRHTITATTTPAWGLAANTALTGGTPAVSTAYAIRAQLGATDILTVNGVGVISGDGGAVSEAGMSVGTAHTTSQFHNGRIYEIIKINAAMSAGELAALQAYVLAYWNLTL